MTGSPDAEFEKIFDLLNAFEQLDEGKQRAFLKSADPLLISQSRLPLIHDCLEPRAENNLATNIMAALARLAR